MEVKTDNNLADIASKAITSSKMGKKSIWLRRFQFMWSSQELSISEDDPEVKQKKKVFLVKRETYVDQDDEIETHCCENLEVEKKSS